MVELLDKIAKNIVYLWSDAKKGQGAILRDEDAKWGLISGEKGYFTLGEKGLECLNKTISQLKSELDTDDNVFSDSLIKKLISDSVINLLPCEKSKIRVLSEKEAKNIINELTKSLKEFKIVVPLQNFKSELDIFEIGKVVFTRFDVENYEFIMNLLNGKANKPIKKIVEKFSGKMVAKIKVKTLDIKKAEEVALGQIELALDVIRFYSLNLHFQQSTFLRNYFNVVGRVFSDTTPMVAYEIEKGTGSFQSSRYGYLYSYEYSKKFHEIMYKLNFEILNQILKTEESERTEFEKRIVSAIRLFGSCFMSEENYDAVLKMTIALESLLLKERESKKDNLTERMALIIANTLDDRLKVLEIMGRLYEIRSEIVHQGSIDVNINDRNQLKYYTFLCIVTLLGKYKTEKIMNINDLINWINKLKFS